MRTRILVLALICGFIPYFPITGTERLTTFVRGTTCDALLRLLLNEPGVERVLKQRKTDRELLDSNGVDADSPSQRARNLLLGMARDTQLRRLLVNALLADQTVRSRNLEEQLTAAANSKEIDERSQLWNIIVLGAGIHDQIVNNILANENSSLKVLTIEKENTLVPNFSLAGDFFRINSTNRPSRKGVVPKPGQGNLNEFPEGPIQVPDLDGTKYPSARVLADASIINRATAGADILFGESVTKVEDKFSSEDPASSTWPARYKITSVGRQGIHYAFAQKVINASGFGEPKAGITDRASLRVIDENTESIKTFEEVVRTANDSEKPYRNYVDKEIAVIGIGDSAKVTLEFLLGLAPSEAYKDDVAQLGRFKSIDWFGQNKKDCDDFINNTRVRYAGIAGGIKNGSVVPRDGRLEKI